MITRKGYYNPALFVVPFMLFIIVLPAVVFTVIIIGGVEIENTQSDCVVITDVFYQPTMLKPGSEFSIFFSIRNRCRTDMYVFAKIDEREKYIVGSINRFTFKNSNIRNSALLGKLKPNEENMYYSVVEVNEDTPNGVYDIYITVTGEDYTGQIEQKTESKSMLQISISKEV